ncbi:PPOX class F420-dependent oxidoreductase [Rathayibacter sp. CAU 1779]
MTASDIIPEDLLPLLNEPNFGFLGTIRPDDTVQVNPMWFEFDGELIRFTHTTKRQKYRNLQRNPTMSLAIVRERSFYRFLEVRGRLVNVVPDPEGEFYVRLARRYGETDPQAPEDRADRVILVMSVEHAVTN